MMMRAINARRALGAALVALALVLTGCTGTPAATDATDEPQQEQDANFDAYAVFGGQWRGSVEGAGDQTPYGTNNGAEPMLDVYLNEDGTCSVEPLEAHKDLLTEEGTWSADDAASVTLSLPSGDITLTAVDDITLEADPTAFGIEGFDVLTLVLY